MQIGSRMKSGLLAICILIISIMFSGCGNVDTSDNVKGKSVEQTVTFEAVVVMETMLNTLYNVAIATTAMSIILFLVTIATKNNTAYKISKIMIIISIIFWIFELIIAVGLLGTNLI